MKRIKLINLFYIIILATVLLSYTCSFCNASQIIVNPNLPITEQPIPDEIPTVMGKVLGTIRALGTIASVLILAVIGVQYILASPEGKVDYKKNMYPYIIGAVLLFSGTTLVEFLYNTFHK